MGSSIASEHPWTWDKKTRGLSWLCSFACFHAWSRRRERRGFARHNDNFTQCCLRQRNTPTTLFPRETLSHLKKISSGRNTAANLILAHQNGPLCCAAGQPNHIIAPSLLLSPKIGLVLMGNQRTLQGFFVNPLTHNELLPRLFEEFGQLDGRLSKEKSWNLHVLGASSGKHEVVGGKR